MDDQPTNNPVQSPETIAEKVHSILMLGTMLLACGAGAYRVKAAMSRAAKAIGLTRLESSVSMTDITATAWRGQESYTSFAEQRRVGVNAEKLDRIMQGVAHLHEGMTANDLLTMLRETSAKDRHYGLWTTVLASAVACAGFCFLNGGRSVECATVFFAAGIGQLIRKLLLGRGYAHFLTWILCAVASTLVYILLLEAGHAGGLLVLHQYESGLISSILYLIPGFPLTTAMLDFVRNDTQSALARFSYCIMVIGSAGVSVWVVVHTLDWQVEPGVTEPLSFWTMTFLRILTSFVAAYGFAILFNAPWKVCTAAAVAGAFANTGRLLLQENVNLPWQLGVGLAAMVVGIVATLVAWQTSHSRVSLSVPAVVIMIPGVPFYRALVAINEGDFQSALAIFAKVFFVIMSIGFGLAIARVVMDEGWRHDTDTSHLPDTLETDIRDAV
ncbi:threonine/serine ThrE exporter family protein [Arcanobacterium pinnipediorum]|uniref:Threonine/serine exporter family protein n=1 Tax=Arcanobacterium pinnipediorum TaxID=1503041 RepID=A0ABY5AHV5_9ACTO|nr:threonine/serine exporter family protein [Arcanobacterium pinnipediorum]USR79790.1 threonine/serine exporter family protein [Arcanobacterium pinnipediorum]